MIQELYWSLTQKVKHPILPETAGEIVSDLLRWPLAVNDGMNILQAIDLQIAQDGLGPGLATTHSENKDPEPDDPSFTTR